MKIFALLALFLTLVSTPKLALAVDLQQIEKELAGEGAVGWVHGAVSDRNLYVFSYRNPENFFDSIDMSLTTESAEVNAILKTLGRHDKIRVKGKFLDNPSPQKHIDASSIEIVEKYSSGHETPPYEYEAKIPDELLNQSSAEFLVHAVAGEGHILVLEFKDQVVPVYVKNADYAKNLYRNDIIKLSYKIQRNPGSPTHLRVDDTIPEPLKVIDSIVSLHEKPADVEGALILFPKAPGIKFNVFAVQQVLRSGLKRQFTLLNFESPDVFQKIREKLQKAWDKHGNDYMNGRNKLVSRKIRVHVKGVFNEVDPNQANAQIILDSADAIEILD